MQKQEAESMHNIWLIAKREYTERIRTKGFIIATVLIPALMGGGIFATAALATHSKTASHIAIVTSQSQPAADLKHELESGKDTTMTVDIVPPSSGITATLDKQIDNKQLDGYLVIHPASAPQQDTFD